MSKFKLQIHPEGFNEARRDARLQEELNKRGQAIADAAGGLPDFEVIDEPTPTRARVVVITATVDGMLAEMNDRALTKAFDAGRG